MTSLPPSPTPTSTETASGKQLRNLLIVIAAVALSLLLGFGVQQQSARPSLTTLAQAAIPLDSALTNGKPSLVEFYANWCTSCQAMVDDMAAVKTEYDGRVNFVMLNVDNNKWLPEVMRYRVDGIPHFVFLDRNGNTIASAVGEQPRSILASNLDALAAGTPLAQGNSGPTSVFQPAMTDGASDGVSDPRAHGSSTPRT
jgi:thiol-disulfide isomerase/thioredoxin